LQNGNRQSTSAAVLRQSCNIDWNLEADFSNMQKNPFEDSGREALSAFSAGTSMTAGRSFDPPQRPATKT